MPFAGRTTRKDNLKSKSSAIKPQVVDEIQPSIIVPGLKSIALLKERNAIRKSLASSTKVDDPKAPLDITGEEIEDSKLESKMVGRISSRKSKISPKQKDDDSPSKETSESHCINIEAYTDTIKPKSKRKNSDVVYMSTTDHSKKKTTPSKQLKMDISNNNMDIDSYDANIVKSDEPKSIKMRGTPTKGRIQRKVNAMDIMDVVEEEQNKTIKINTDPNNAKIPKVKGIPTKIRSQTKVNVPDVMEVVEEEQKNIDTVSMVDEAKIPKMRGTPSKSRAQKKAIMPEVMEVVEEGDNRTVIIDSVGLVNEAKIHKVKGTPTKSRIQKKVNVPDVMEVVEEEQNKIVNMDKVSMVDEAKIPKVKGTPTKSRTQKKVNIPDVMEIVEEEIQKDKVTDDKMSKTNESRTLLRMNTTEIMDVDEGKDQNTATKLDSEVLTKDTKSRGRKARGLTTSEDQNIEIDDLKIYAKNLSENATLNEKKSVSKVAIKNLPNQTHAEPTNVIIPGMAMLQNLKNRKSGLLARDDDKPNLTTLKIPGLEFITDIKRKKSLAIELKDKEIVTSLETLPSLGNDKVTENTPSRNNSDLTKPKSTIKTTEKSRVNVSQTNSSTNQIIETKSDVKSEIIPGLNNTADLRRRKSTLFGDEVFAAVSKTQKGVTPTKSVKSTIPTNAIIPGLSYKAQIKQLNEQSTAPEKSIEVPTTISTPKKSQLNSKKPALESPKIPGFTVLEEMRNRKSTPVKTDSPLKTSSLFKSQSSVVSKIPLFTGDSSFSTNAPQITQPKVVSTPVPQFTSFHGSNSLLRSKNAMSQDKPSILGNVMSQESSVQNSTNQGLPLFSGSDITPKTALYSGSYTTTQKPPLYSVSTPITQKSSLSKSNTFSTPKTQWNNNLNPSKSMYSSPQISAKPTSILRTPVSNFKNNTVQPNDEGRSSKRPISCLDEEEQQIKRAKTENNDVNDINPLRRRSVTFSNRVQLKEIKGNSFNSESDDHEMANADHMNSNDELAAINQQIEKVKKDLERKRQISANPFSQPNITQYGAVKTMNYAPGNQSSKKGTSMLDEKFLKRKAQYKADVAAGKIQNPPPPAEKYDFSNSVVNKNLSNDISDDEMEVDDSSKKTSNCSIM